VLAEVTPIGKPSIDPVPLLVRTGFDIVGAVPNTKAPVPVSSVTADAKFALDGVAKNAATPVPNPLMPVATGKPVALASVIVGPVANTNAPVPVSSVTAVRRLALEGVERNVAIPEPRPETPDEIGKLVQLVNVPEIGVPNAGADNDTLVKKLAIEICFVTPL